MAIQPRLLPLLILAAMAMLTLKLGAIWDGALSQRGSAQARPALAAAQVQGDVPLAQQEASVPSNDREFGAGSAVPDTGSAASDSRDIFDPSQLSRSEVRLLQELAKRRSALDERERELDQREALLRAAEQRLVGEQAEMVQMRDHLKTMLLQLDEKERERIANLVKIYENMKPLDAATIFNELDLPILLSVVERMSVRKAAPVIAAMEPARARTVTHALAERENRLKGSGMLEPPMAGNEHPSPVSRR